VVAQNLGPKRAGRKPRPTSDGSAEGGELGITDEKRDLRKRKLALSNIRERQIPPRILDEGAIAQSIVMELSLNGIEGQSELGRDALDRRESLRQPRPNSAPNLIGDAEPDILAFG
jgi:hypothetical protein